MPKYQDLYPDFPTFDQVKRIVLLGGQKGTAEPNSDITPIDVIVEFNAGKKFGASFFTLESIEKINQEHEATGDYLKGKFFWVPQIILIQEYTAEMVLSVVQFLIEEGDFKEAFKPI